MAKFGEESDLVKCSFCGKSQKQVGKLIAGPGVYICNECIALCNDIIDEVGIVDQDGDFRSPPEDNVVSAENTKVSMTHERLTGRYGRRPTVAELAVKLGLDEDKIAEILRRASPRPPETGVQAWSPDEGDLAPLPVALRRIQHQLSELSQRLAGLVQRVERRDDP